jgi:hypothetical protein
MYPDPQNQLPNIDLGITRLLKFSGRHCLPDDRHLLTLLISNDDDVDDHEYRTEKLHQVEQLNVVIEWITLLYILEVRVQVSAWRPDILTGFRGVSQFLQANAEIVP